jgi:hypothetical protein
MTSYRISIVVLCVFTLAILVTLLRSAQNFASYPSAQPAFAESMTAITPISLKEELANLLTSTSGSVPTIVTRILPDMNMTGGA